MYKTEVIAHLLHKKINNQLSPEEKAILRNWSSLSSFNELILMRVENEKMVFDDVLALLELGVDDHDSFYQHIENSVFAKIKLQQAYKGKKIRSLILRYAALVLLFFTLGFLYFKYGEREVVVVENLFATNNSAVIKLSSGEVVVLDSNKRELVLDSLLTYADGSVITDFNSESDVDITLEIPKGHGYYVRLSDESEVWLNSDSKLVYPMSFQSDKRIVRLEGEAYFKVAKRVGHDSRNIPFIVITKDQTIEVLGTSFNVKSYSDDDVIESTLVSGSVKVFAGGLDIVLKPGEQIRNYNNQVTKHKVDVDQYVAWLDNSFLFHETELKDVLLTLSRWYDFEIEDIDKLPNTHIYGSISRSKSLSDVLRLMKTSGLDFKIVHINGINRLIVKNNQK